MTFEKHFAHKFWIGLVILVLISMGNSQIQVLDLQVNSGDNDAYEAPTAFYISKDFLSLQASPPGGSISTVAGMRFTNITIPQGASITSAVLEIYFGPYNNLNYDIKAEDTDNPKDFVVENNFISRSRTTAFVQWTENNLGQDVFSASPDISGIIQAVVDRSRWNSGNAMVILMDPRDDAFSMGRISSYEVNSSQAAKLHIEYSSGLTGFKFYNNSDGGQNHFANKVKAENWSHSNLFNTSSIIYFAQPKNSSNIFIHDLRGKKVMQFILNNHRRLE